MNLKKRLIDKLETQTKTLEDALAKGLISEIDSINKPFRYSIDPNLFGVSVVDRPIFKDGGRTYSSFLFALKMRRTSDLTIPFSDMEQTARNLLLKSLQKEIRSRFDFIYEVIEQRPEVLGYVLNEIVYYCIGVKKQHGDEPHKAPQTTTGK